FPSSVLLAWVSHSFCSRARELAATRRVTYAVCSLSLPRAESAMGKKLLAENAEIPTGGETIDVRNAEQHLHD
ncbi:unnamed protein product, partial [Closterium sp. NIES-54]